MASARRRQAGIVIKNEREFRQAFREAPKLLARNMHDGLLRAFLGFRKSVVARIGLRSRGGKSGIRSNRAWPVRVTSNKRDLRTLKGRVFNTWRGAPMHEFGGTVRPKRGRYLALPIGESLRGGPRAGPRAGFAKKGRESLRRFISARETTHRIDIIPARRVGGLLVFIRRRTTKRRPKRPSWLLLRGSVRIRPRLNFFRTWDETLPRFIERLHESGIERTLKQVAQRTRRRRA